MDPREINAKEVYAVISSFGTCQASFCRRGIPKCHYVKSTASDKDLGGWKGKD